MLNPSIGSLQTSPALTVYRMNCLKANVSVDGLEEMQEFSYYYSRDGLSLGYVYELPRSYVGPVLNSLITDLKRLRSIVLENSVSVLMKHQGLWRRSVWFSILFQKCDFIEVVARLSLYKNKLNLDNLTQYIATIVTARLEMEMSQWLSVQLDIASTNRAVITKIKYSMLWRSSLRISIMLEKYSVM